MTLEQHLAENGINIEEEAREYAKQYGCDYATALREVTDEYRQGWFDSLDEAREYQP